MDWDGKVKILTMMVGIQNLLQVPLVVRLGIEGRAPHARRPGRHQQDQECRGPSSPGPPVDGFRAHVAQGPLLHLFKTSFQIGMT